MTVYMFVIAQLFSSGGELQVRSEGAWAAGQVRLVADVRPAPANPWTGEQGKNRIMGLALTAGGGGGLGSASLIMLMTGLVWLTAPGYGAVGYPYGSTYPYGYYGYGYGGGLAFGAVPYLIIGTMLLAGAVVCLVIGIPMLKKGFPQAGGSAAGRSVSPDGARVAARQSGPAPAWAVR